MILFLIVALLVIGFIYSLTFGVLEKCFNCGISYKPYPGDICCSKCVQKVLRKGTPQDELR